MKSIAEVRKVSLSELFNAPEKICGENKHNIESLAYVICRGGWPHAIGMKENAALSQGIGSKDLINDLNTFGLLFETLCVRDLRVYAESLGGEVLHYRDKSGLECDAVIHLKNGTYGMAEIKLGGDRLIEEGVANLKALAEKIDTTKMKAPAFMMIVVGVGDFAYRREDGIYIVPIGCLKN